MNDQSISDVTTIIKVVYIKQANKSNYKENKISIQLIAVLE